MIMKKTILILFPIITVCLIVYYYIPKLNSPAVETKEIFIGNTRIHAELADTPEKMTRGLSGRKYIDKNKGMIFSYNEPGIYSFWMKDMKFPIDIIWVGANEKIVDITKSAIPESYPKTFSSKEPAKYVIETNSGWCDQNNIKIGNTAVILYEYEAKIKAKENLIKAKNPNIGNVISSPLVIEGEARGNWFFEASFPVKIIDSNGNELAIKPATATSDWMTTEFVPFAVSLEFNPPKETDIGFLILKKDNPSGLPENEDEIQIPIRFR
jgi:uncharacterized membrane protein (UPF0127 family)